MQRLQQLLSRFRKDERGVFLVIFAVIGIVLVATSGAVVDFSRVQQARTHAQTGLDAAALALQGDITSPGVTPETLRADAEELLIERIADASITAVVVSATPLTSEGKLTLSAYIEVPTYFVQLVGIRTIRANVLSQVTRQSSDLEVSVAADITYSMLGSKLTALQDALKFTIGELVSTSQPPDAPTYSKMAIAPYSNGVNVGAYADNVRGPITAGISITNVAGTTGTVKTISAVTKATNLNLYTTITTSANHGFSNDDFVYIGGVTGMTQLTEGIYRVGSKTNTTFRLIRASDNSNYDSRTWSNYTANSGRVIKCATATCKITVTTQSNHNFANTDIVWITGSGATYFNNAATEVTEKTNTTFVPKGVTPLTSNIIGTGGTAYCTKYRCEYYRFTNASSTTNMFRPTECAVERTTSTYASLDTPPSTDFLGIQYAPENGRYPGSPELEACPVVAIQPLTSSRSTLTDLVDDFVAQGSTAGHLGLAWAWYMLSPDFLTGAIGTQWPADSKPAAYKKSKLVKAIILMTDGDFNTMYNVGIPAKDAGIINNANKSSGNAPYGSSSTQATALCTEIKKSKYGILLYTIGFGITTNSAGDKFLKACATSPTMYKTASDATTLKAAFAAIAQSLSELRISR